MPSDMPPGAVPNDQGQHWGPPPSAASIPSAQTPPALPMALGRPPRWPALTALAIALIALAVGLVGWFRPAPHNNQPLPKPTYTEQQTADAKAKVCAAFGELDRAVGVLKALPHGTDPVVEAVNIRQVFDVFSRHFFATLSEEPATPADLATAMRKQASSLEELVIGYQDGFTSADPEMQPSLHVNDATADTIRQLCK
ncbi:MAG TPA: hypothetical protein VG187_05370 [Mycobacterium sp.]|jgi:hypothetical protein|nr:hypothetical protein [Mycobacterium sp.]